MIASAAASPSAESLWAITSYFNPMRYQRRLLNYRLFRERLNLPLVTVELAYGADFELTEDDADILVQLRGGDVMWQKERLLNVALQALPPTCRKVVHLDCDIIFEADDWSEQVSRLLDRFWTIQLFSHAHYLRRDWTPDALPRHAVEFTRTAIACAIASGVPALYCFRQPAEPRQASYSKGHAWATRRELLDQHGFYDANILGGGERATAAACYGVFNEIARHQCMNERQAHGIWPGRSVSMRLFMRRQPSWTAIFSISGMVSCGTGTRVHGTKVLSPLTSIHSKISR